MADYDLEKALKELDERFEPGVRRAWDSYGGGFPYPFFVIIAKHNYNTGKDFDEPTPMPVAWDGDPSGVQPEALVNLVRKHCTLSQGVAVFCAYAHERGVKVRLELPSESHEWLLPGVPQKGGPPFLGRRLDYSHGTGQTARLLNDVDKFGGVFVQTGLGSIPRTTIEA